MRQHHLIQPWVPSQPTPCTISPTEMPAVAVHSGALVKGCRMGLSLHLSDPRARCMRNSMASRNHGCVLGLELFLRAVSLGTCGFTHQLYSPPMAAVSKLRIVIPDPVKARGNILLPHHAHEPQH